MKLKSLNRNITYVQVKMEALDCVKFVRIRIFSDPYFFLIQINSYDMFFYAEIQVREDPYSDVFYVVLLLLNDVNIRIFFNLYIQASAIQ